MGPVVWDSPRGWFSPIRPAPKDHLLLGGKFKLSKTEKLRKNRILTENRKIAQNWFFLYNYIFKRYLFQYQIYATLLDSSGTLYRLPAAHRLAGTVPI